MEDPAGKERMAKDWSAEERFYNRSKRIRKRVRDWLFLKIGEHFDTSSVMSDQAANFAGCSSITAYRWIHQFSVDGDPKKAPFRITEDENGLYLSLREDQIGPDNAKK